MDPEQLNSLCQFVDQRPKLARFLASFYTIARPLCERYMRKFQHSPGWWTTTDLALKATDFVKSLEAHGIDLRESEVTELRRTYREALHEFETRQRNDDTWTCSERPRTMMKFSWKRTVRSHYRDFFYVPE